MATVYRKTAKGQTEIETRAHRLLPRLRSALILVDGRKTDVELAGLILAEPAATLAGLLADGFIEVLAEQPAERTEVAARSSSSGGVPFETLRRDAVHELNHQIGPIAQTLTLNIERAKTQAELQPLLTQAAQMLRNLRGNASADAFTARFLAPPAA